MRAKRNKSLQLAFNVEDISTLVQNRFRVTSHKDAKWFLEGWVVPLTRGAQDQEDFPSIFLKVSGGFPVGQIRQAYSEILKRLGKVGNNRRHLDEIAWELNEYVRAEEAEGRSPTNSDIKNKLSELQQKIAPYFEYITMQEFIDKNRKQKSLLSQPSRHVRHFKYPQDQIKWIINEGKRQKRNHDELSWHEIAENIKYDFDDEVGQHPRWIGCTSRTLSEILKKQSTYLKKRHS